MKEPLRIVFVLTGVAAACGLMLACVNELTSGSILQQRIRFAYGPALHTVLPDSNNDPVTDFTGFDIDGTKVLLYRGKKNGTLTGIALVTEAKGFAGPLSVASGFDPATGRCITIAVAISNETPGIGSKTSSTLFSRQFDDLAITTRAALVVDGGSIDGISGATVSSRAICKAVAAAQHIFESYRTTSAGAPP